jgi:hypothetical protein
MVLALVLVLSLFSPLASAPARAETGSFYRQDGSRAFPETSHTVKGAFLDYWNRNGGLFIFGYPISDPFEEKNFDDGKTYLVQYFERNRFELHPENKGNQYEVLMARFGALLTTNRTLEGNFKPISVFTSTTDRIFLTETGHSLSGRFLDYWNKNGGVSIFGFPISEPLEEVSPTDGNKYLVQYFERNRFEYHPENAGNQFEVLLGLLGSEFMKNAPTTSTTPTGATPVVTTTTAPTTAPVVATTAAPTTVAPATPTSTPVAKTTTAPTTAPVATATSTPTAKGTTAPVATTPATSTPTTKATTAPTTVPATKATTVPTTAPVATTAPATTATPTSSSASPTPGTSSTPTSGGSSNFTSVLGDEQLVQNRMSVSQLQSLLDKQPGILKNYRENIQGKTLSASESLVFFGDWHDYQLSPLVMLSLLELRARVISDPNLQIETLKSAFTELVGSAEALPYQIMAVGRQLNKDFISFNSNQLYIFKNGFALTPKSGTNAATFAVGNLLAKYYDRTHLNCVGLKAGKYSNIQEPQSRPKLGHKL